jgi:hypothetical protein
MLFALTFLFGNVPAVYAATIYANNSTGNDSTGNGMSGSPYLTFTKAYMSASVGDTSTSPARLRGSILERQVTL